MTSTSNRSTSSPPGDEDALKAIHDPFGHGHEGRIGVDRETFARRKGIAAVLHQFATRGLKALEAAQYEYLITHGFYTTEELEDHPGRPTPKDIQSPDVLDLEKQARADAALAEHIKKVDAERWRRRSGRIVRWEVIRCEKQPPQAQRAVSWAFQDPESGSETEDEAGEEREGEREREREGSGRGGFRGGRGRGGGGG